MREEKPSDINELEPYLMQIPRSGSDLQVLVGRYLSDHAFDWFEHITARARSIKFFPLPTWDEPRSI